VSSISRGRGGPFGSRKTVDNQVGHVYPKLEVPRDGLAAALAAKD
jgi:DNA-binding CsgD family transcriptional regulator